MNYYFTKKLNYYARIRIVFSTLDTTRKNVSLLEETRKKRCFQCDDCICAPVWCRSAHTRLIDSVLIGRLAHDHWMPASHSKGPPTCTLRHPAS